MSARTVFSVLTILLGVRLVCDPNPVHGQHFSFETYSVEHGLVQSQVLSILQDSKGYLWLGTVAGVSKFDGHRFVNYTEAEGESIGAVADLFEDREGRIWVASVGHGAFVMAGSTWSHFDESDSLASNYVRAIGEDADGNIWIATHKGVSKFDGRRFYTYGEEHGLNSDLVLALAKDKSGDLWFGTKAGVCRFDGVSFADFSAGAALDSLYVADIFQDRDGCLWFATSAGAFRYDGSDDLQRFSQADGLPGKNVNDITQDDAGNLWMASSDGVAIYDGRRITTLTTKQGLPTNRIWVIQKDTEGNIWLGTDAAGVSRFRGDMFAHFGEPEGFGAAAIISILEDSNGTYWFGAIDEGVFKWDGDTLSNLTTDDGLLDNVVFSCLEDANGHIWFGTEKGASRYDGHTFEHYLTEGNGTFIIDMIRDRQDNLWFATARAGVFKYDGQTFKNFTTADGLGSNRVDALLADARGRMWFGTARGLTVYEDGAFHNLQTLGETDLELISTLNQDSSGALWIGTFGDGLLVYHPDRPETAVTNITTSAGLSNNEVMLSVFDASGRLWVGTIMGVNRIDVPAFYGSGKLDIKRYAKPEGFVGIECNHKAALRDSHGDLWFGTVAGITRCTPANERPNQEPARIHITDLRIFFKHVDWQGSGNALDDGNGLPIHPRLRNNQNHITFDFVGISLTNPQNVKYRYKLEGFDQSWSPVTTEQSATYSNLPPGKFVFKVRASNSEGIWNEQSVTYAFTITPPFWRTWWFFLLTVCVLAGTVWGIVGFRTRQLQQRRCQLEHIVQCRTSELQAEKKKVEQAAKELEKLSLVASEADNAVIIANAEGEIEWVNAGFTRISGFDLEEYKRTRGKTLIEASTNPMIADVISECIQDKKSVTYETINVSQEGREYWVSSTVTPIFDRDDKLQNLITIDADISPLKLTEQALLQSQTRLTLLNAIATGIRSRSSVEQIIEETLQLTSSYFKSYRLAYFAIDAESKATATHTVHPAAMPAIDNLTLDMASARRYAETLKKQTPVAVPDVKKSSILAPFQTDLNRVRARAVLDVPIVYDSKLVGMVSFHARTPHSWTEHETMTLREIANYLILLFNDAFQQQERSRVERQVLIQKVYFEQLFENSPEAIVLLDLDGHIMQTNSEFTKMFGYSSEEAVGKSVDELIVPDDASETPRAHGLRSDQKLNMELTCRRKDGRRVHNSLLSTPVKVEGECVAVYRIYRDITEWKQSEEALRSLNQQLLNNEIELSAANSQLKASLEQLQVNETFLRESEQKYRTLFNHIADPVFIVDKESGKFLDCNNAVLRVYGYTRNELSCMNPLDLLPPEEPHDLESVICKTTTEPPAAYLNVTRDGKRMWVESVTDEIEYQGREAWITIIRDVTERKRAEEELKTAKETAESANQRLMKTNADLEKAISLAKEMARRAEAANVAKSDFLANMSHEIRTPMNAIIGMTELVLETTLTSEQIGYVNVVQSASEGLLSLIDDILDFSKIEAGQMEIETIDFRLADIVEGVAEIFSSRAESKGIELLCYVEPDIPPRLVGDPTRLRQILVNLVGNAIKFTEAGHIAIKAELRSLEQSQEPEASQAHLHFKVEDTGIGISPENITKIFEKFSQEDTSTTRRFGGTGLGLNISKSLIEMMQGELWVESEMGRGSVFQFTLPLLVDEHNEPLPDFSADALRDTTVLVVDDNEINRFILRKTLEARHIEVLEAESGQQTLRILEQENHRIRMVILDQQMPEMDGLQLARKIREQPEYDDIKMVMLSSLRLLNSNLKRELNISQSIIKPVKQSQLIDILSRAMREGNESLGAVHVVREDSDRPRIQKRILLVEDNIDNQKLACRILEKSGFIVDVADNGELAVEAVKRFVYDLILMDIYMPVMDGFEATHRIRAYERLKKIEHVPIIALTAHAVQGYREKCLRHEMDDYITKPVKRKPLLAVIQRLLDSRPTILVVDDSVDNRTLLLHHLQKAGDFKIVTADQGEEALREFNARTVSIVLMDMEMPVLDGYAAATEMRKLEHGHDVPIIALTAHRGKQEVDKCLDAGCSDYLSKPIRHSALMKTLRRYLAAD